MPLLDEVKTKDIVVVGIDLSVTSPGLVAINCFSHEVLKQGYCTQKKKYSDWMEVSKWLGTENLQVSVIKPRRTTKTKTEDVEPVDLFVPRRRLFLAECVKSFVENIAKSMHVVVGIEDYAYGSKSASQFELAEISGLIRNWLWVRDIPVRFYDPTSIKKFATCNGHAAKIHMVAKALELGFKVPMELIESGTKFKYPVENPFNVHGERLVKDYAGPGADMADAFHIARMLALEIKVRRGEHYLDKLEAWERNEFLKITKSRDVNLLDRPYVAMNGEWVDGC